MAVRLYLKNCYLRDFSATITELTTKEAILDQTVFYPESGGQLGDQGLIKCDNLEWKITNTRLRKGKIVHELESIEGLSVGMQIRGKLDWNRRYLQMRAHTAQHVISRFFQVKYQAETVSNQLKTTSNRLDLHPLSKISSDELTAISAQINDLIARDWPVVISFLPRKEAIRFLQEKEYQTQYLNMVPKSVQEFRIISIDEWDWAACAGTHVRNTSEIGRISLDKTVNKGKHRERIYYTLN